MNHAALLKELNEDPTGAGYAALLPSSPGLVVEMLNAQKYSAPKSLMISERGIMAKYPGGPVAADAVLSKLEAFSTSGAPMSSVLKRTLKFLAQPEGIDIGSTAAQAMLDQLASGGVITAGEAADLKSLANQPTSRAEVIGYGSISESDLREAGAI